MPSDATSAIWAAFIGAAASVGGLAHALVRDGRSGQVARQRNEYASALAAALKYLEFPYVIRRRRHDIPEEERVRISTEVQAVQQELAYYTAWLQIGPLRISSAYIDVVDEAREVAGKAMHEAWLSDPAESDEAMNTAALNLNRFRSLQDEYLREVSDHLAWTPSTIRRLRWKLRGGRRTARSD